MEITVENLSPIKKKIGIALPPEAVQAELDEAYRGLQRRAHIKGFRPGKVPRPVLERFYGDQVRSEVIGKLIQDSYVRALTEHNLHAVARPEIVAEEVAPEAGLRYSATIEIKPEFQVGGYDALEVEREIPLVSDEAVDEQLERLRQSFAQMVKVEDRDVVADQDLVEIGYTGVVDGRVLPGATVPSRVLEIGSQTFPPPFEETLVGKRRGESVHVNVTYPDHHRSPEIAGKTVTFRVEIKEIGRKELPALDDEFAKDHGECGSLAELRAKIRAGLEAAATREADERVRVALMKQLVERNPVDVPDAMVESRFESMAHEIGIHGATSGGNPELETQLDGIRAELRQRAREAVHSGLLLERLAQQEHLEVTEADVDERVAQVVRAAPRERERLAEIYRTPEARHDVAERLAQEKALAWLVGRATVRDRPHQT